MKVTTKHQFIDQYPVLNNHTIAIVGTIHPHILENFLMLYFYGNVGSIWTILGDAFPNHNFKELNSIKHVLDNHGIWVTDIIKQCDRENEKITEDKHLKNLILNEAILKKSLENSNIDTILFASAFGKNNATKLFVDLFDINYKTTYNTTTREFIIPSKHFGRPIKGVVLYSPSGQANIGISKSHSYISNIDRYKQFLQPVKQFKIDFYKEKFSVLSA